MGNTLQKESLNLSSKEQEIIRNKFETGRFNDLSPLIHPRLVKALKQVTSQYPGVEGWILLASKLLHSNPREWTLFLDAFNCSAKEFAQYLVSSSIGIYSGASINNSLDRFLNFILDSAAGQASKTKFDEPVSGVLLSEWFANSFYFKKLFSIFCDFVFFDKTTLACPVQNSSLLSPDLAFVLESNIQSSKSKWRLGFSSEKHGKSWTVFSDKLRDAELSLIIIRDKRGYSFGGFATEPWDHKTQFYGNSSSFLFTLSPKIDIFKATGLNTNFQYFCNHTKTFTNGLGFGGQIDYFGLFLFDDLERGSCRSEPRSTTFNNTLLSSTPDFNIDTVEVWIIKERQIDDRLIEKSKASVLETGAGEAAFLEIAGKKMYSKDVKEQKIEF